MGTTPSKVLGPGTSTRVHGVSQRACVTEAGISRPVQSNRYTMPATYVIKNFLMKKAGRTGDINFNNISYLTQYI